MSWRRYVCAVGITFAVGTLRAETAPWYQTDFPPEEFRARWEKIFAKIGDKSVALVAGAPSVGGFVFPRQFNEFYYLCGVETPGSYILLDGRSRKATLFLPPRNARLEAAEGKVLSADDKDLVKKLVGVDDVQSAEAMRGDWLAGASGALPESIWTPFAPGGAVGRAAIRAPGLERRDRSRSLGRADSSRGAPRGPSARALSAGEDPRSDAGARRASERQEPARSRAPAARGTDRRPGTARSDAIDPPGSLRVRARRGGPLRLSRQRRAARGIPVDHRFRAPTTSGTCTTSETTAALAAGDIVLMDYAPDYRYYTSDIARIWPVSGKYSPIQRELLGFVLAYRNEIMKRIRPGVAPKQIQEEAKAAMEPVFAQDALLQAASTSRRRGSSSKRAAASSRIRSAWRFTTTAGTPTGRSCPASSSRSTRSCAFRRRISTSATKTSSS